MSPRPHYERHRDDDIIDEVTFRVVPRYKTSGLSGDEWRVSTVVELKRKGTVIYTRGYHRMGDAAAHLPWLLRTWCEMPDEEIPEWMKQIKRDESLCHQPGCAELGTVIYRIKQRVSREGWPEPADHVYGEQRRAFCDRHAQRGDCGLEDSDSNYEVVGKNVVVPDVAEGDRAPSVFGGFIDARDLLKEDT